MNVNSYGLAIVLLLATPISHASDDVSLGAGVGALYSGIGINVAKRSENDFGYLAAGCVALGYSSAEGSVTACGIGAGWMWADILSSVNHNHGLGLYLGPVGWRRRSNVARNSETVYGLGVTYAYFFNGIGVDGWNLGATLAVGHNDDANGYLLVQAGYQF